MRFAPPRVLIFFLLRQHVLKLTQGELDADALFESAVRHLPVVVVVSWVGLALAELAETRGHDDRGHRENMFNQSVLKISKNRFFTKFKNYPKTYFLTQDRKIKQNIETLNKQYLFNKQYKT